MYSIIWWVYTYVQFWLIEILLSRAVILNANKIDIVIVCDLIVLNLMWLLVYLPTIGYLFIHWFIHILINQFNYPFIDIWRFIYQLYLFINKEYITSYSNFWFPTFLFLLSLLMIDNKCNERNFCSIFLD